MRCLSCQYDLSHLIEHRCPECGRAFDPFDFKTVDLQTMKPWKAVLIGLVIAVFIVLAMVFPLIMAIYQGIDC